MKIEEIREEIDKIDDQIIELLSKRKELVNKIALIKKENNIEIDDLKREEEVIRKVLEKAKKKEIDEKVIKQIFNLILEDSKKQQKKYF